MNYAVSEIYETVQGEGALCGTPVTLVRLQGCSVGCSWCDTKQSWDKYAGQPMRAADIANLWKLKRKNSEWVLLTGGEPAEQDLREMVILLRDFGARIMLETSGTAEGFLSCANHIEHITLSPKRHKLPLLSCLEASHELKLVVGGDDDIEFWKDYLTGRDQARLLRQGRLSVTVQPEFGSRPASTKAAVNAGRDFGWRVSFQVHKYLGLK